MDKQLEKIKEYFYNIDFLRVIFIFFIVNLHLFGRYELGAYQRIYHDAIMMTRTGYLAVDYFFIIAGFFLLLSFKDAPVIAFIKKKICKFWPLMLFIYIIYAFFGFTNIVKFDWYSNTLALFFLENIGLTNTRSLISITWFLSSLMAASIFYYHIFKHYKKETCDLITCLITLFGYVAIIHTENGTITGDRMGMIGLIFNVGLIRAVAGMGLGIIVYNIYEYFKNENYVETTKKFVFTSIVELGLLWFVVYETGFHRLAFKNKFILIIAFAALLLMFTLKRGYFSRFFNKKVFTNWSKYVLAIYLTHPVILLLYRKLFYTQYPDVLKNFPVFFVMAMYLSIIILAVFAHHFVEKPGARKMQRLLFNREINNKIGEE